MITTTTTAPREPHHPAINAFPSWVRSVHDLNRRTTPRHIRKKFRGLAHREMTLDTYDRLEALLRHHRNTLSGDHQTALTALLSSMTSMAQGKLPGRYAFGIPTGMGKTTAIVAWVSQLHRVGALGNPTSVAAAAMKVEALCTLKRQLIAQGVPENRIALIHSKRFDPANVEAVKDGTADQRILDTYASEPSDDGKDRPIALVTHERVRSCDLDTFGTYRGRRRDLMLYDESLMRSESTGISMVLLRAAVQVLETVFSRQEDRKVIIEYAKDAYTILEGTLERGGGVVTLPSLEDPPYSLTPMQITEAVTWTRTGRHAGTTENAAALLELSGGTVRVIDADQGGMVNYEISVPEEIKNIIILDASHPIRRLIGLDPTIRDAEKRVPACQNLKTPLSKIKRFDRVTIRQMYAGGGRDTMEKDFRTEDKAVLRDVIDVVRNQVPEDESVLIFTFKHRYADRRATDFRAVIQEGLAKAGVENLDRINIATYGQETNLNCWGHCQNVILAGVLQLPPMAVGAAGVGQSDDLERKVDGGDIRDWHRSEVAHVVYQALSRGSCRTATNGYANRMNAWIIHRDPALRTELARVMPGAKWETWKAKHRSASATATLATEIADHLETLPDDTNRISTRKVKEAMGKTEKDGTPGRTWTDAVRCLFDDLHFTSWSLEGRSFVRAGTVFDIE